MANSVTEVIHQKIVLILTVMGLLLITIASSFHLEVYKVKIDHVMAEVGALFLIVGTLHWLFERNLRKEMLKDIATTALGSARIHDSGIVDCLLNAKDVSEISLWKASNTLVIGIHYSTRFLEQIHEILKQRCNNLKETQICVVKPTSMAAEYLEKSQTGIGGISTSIDRIKFLIKACDTNVDKIQILYHERVLRYSFIYTEQFIWIKFFPNSKERTIVPAIKLQSGTPLFTFFESDIKRFIKEAELLSGPNVVLKN